MSGGILLKKKLKLYKIQIKMRFEENVEKKKEKHYLMKEREIMKIKMMVMVKEIHYVIHLKKKKHS